MEKNIDFTNREEVMDLMRNDPDAFFNMIDVIKAEEAERQLAIEGADSEVEAKLEESSDEQSHPRQQARRKVARIAFRR